MTLYSPVNYGTVKYSDVNNGTIKYCIVNFETVNYGIGSDFGRRTHGCQLWILDDQFVTLIVKIDGRKQLK